MAERVQVKKASSKTATKEVATEDPPQQTEAEKARAALSDTDELLAEIDSVLDDVLGEISAQEFVGAFVQKGGE